MMSHYVPEPRGRMHLRLLRSQALSQAAISHLVSGYHATQMPGSTPIRHLVKTPLPARINPRQSFIYLYAVSTDAHLRHFIKTSVPLRLASPPPRPRTSRCSIRRRWRCRTGSKRPGSSKARSSGGYGNGALALPCPRRGRRDRAAAGASGLAGGRFWGAQLALRVRY